MRDPFLNDDFAVARLVEEWKQHGKIIIAYDFDNTVYDYYKRGYTYDQVIDILRRCRAMGAHFIVYASKDESQHEEMKNFLLANDIPFDKINEGMDFIPFKGGKIYYNILLDDRAGLFSAYYILCKAYYQIKMEKGEVNND